jgi:hypothetical protein
MKTASDLLCGARQTTFLSEHRAEQPEGFEHGAQDETSYGGMPRSEAGAV